MIDDDFSNSLDEWFCIEGELPQFEIEIDMNLEDSNCDELELISESVSFCEYEESSLTTSNMYEDDLGSVYSEFEPELSSDKQPSETGEERFSSNSNENSLLDERDIVDLAVAAMSAIGNSGGSSKDKNADNGQTINSDTKKDANPIASSTEKAIIANISKVIDAVGDGVSDPLKDAVSKSIETLSEKVINKIDGNATKPVEASNATETQLPSPPPSEHPHDLTQRICPWLDNCLTLSNSCGCENITAELNALYSRWQLPGFRLGFVGEFSRGKSSLLNRLLNRDLLPVGDLPTTASLTSIKAGAEDRMEVRSSKQQWESRPIAAQSWGDLIAIDQNGNEQDAIAQVRITLAHPWLEELDVELIDTPGVADLSGRRAGLAFELLSQCDAAVLVVSATSPFSMTEATFLQQEVMGRHVPRILVAVSKLDTIPQEERADVLDSIRKRIAKISTDIPVLPIHPVSDSTSEAEALEIVKTHIESMVAKGDRRIWRSRQIAGQITDYLSHLIQVGQLSISIAQMDAVEKQKALSKAKEEMRNAQLQWQTICLNLEQRRLQLTQTLQQEVLQAKAGLMEILSFEIKKTKDPKTWWQEDLPFRLRRELIKLSRELEGYVLKALAQDIEWLQSEVSKLFSPNINQKAVGSSETLKIDLDLGQVSLTDIQQYRLLTRLGGSTATICGYIFGGPVGVAVSTTAWLISEQVIKRKLDEQRQLLNQELERNVDQTIDKYCQRLVDRLRQLYSQLIEDMKREQSVQKSAYDIAFKGNNSEQDENPWQPTIAQASALKKEILQELAH